ncbi:MAG: tetratricopeptide repeat protein [Chloroflexi bacterium]|nr:tetratricopeptide repeat protein [Chloroflexota bacterium]
MTTYTELFTSYILNGARQALEQVQQSTGAIPETVRKQAWHLLEYALTLEAAWPQVRELLLTLSPKMEMAGYRDEWLPFLKAGIERSVAQRDRAVEARLELAVGQLLRLENRYTEAEEWLPRALRSFEEQGDAHGVAAVYNQLGRIRYLQNRDAEAARHAHNALGLLAEEDPERAESHFVLGMAALNQRNWAEAESQHRLSLEVRQGSGDPRTIAWAMQNVGTVLLQQSEYGGVNRLAEAVEWLEQAITLLDSQPDPYHSAVARNSLATVHTHLGHLAEATALYCQAEEIFQRTGSPEWLARVHNNLGLVYLRQGDAVEAERSFRAGVALYEQLGNDATRLNTQHGVVLALLAQQRYAEAAAFCRKGLAELDALREMPAQYAEKEGWYRASLAKAQAGLGE